MQYLRDLLVPVFLFLETEEVFCCFFFSTLQQMCGQDCSLTTPMSENCWTNEPRAYARHSSASNPVWQVHNHFDPGGSTGQDLHSPSEWVRRNDVISSDLPVVSPWICFQTLRLVPVWPIGDGGCPSNLSVLWLAAEGMYGRSSGENVFRAFISTSSDWFPLQLHVLALALQHPLFLTDHFDWSMNSSWGIGRNSSTIVPNALFCFTWADVRSC